MKTIDYKTTKRNKNIYLFLPVLLILLLTLITVKKAYSASNKNEISKYVIDNLRLELRPFAVNTSEAFLQARGFSQDQAKAVAKKACIHKLEIHNTATNAENIAIIIDLKKWIVITSANPPTHPPAVREVWPKRWQNTFAKNMPNKRAKIAFKWALFPTYQVFWPADYNWGLIAFDLEANTEFKLQIQFKIDEKIYKKTFKNLRCGNYNGFT
ncbi:MAG: hypothetical protein HQL71_00900 [Magnetococcales bacterium]|nr:hypothetical protein [Magnetococcales bacterium]